MARANLLSEEVEGQALIYGNSFDGGLVIYTDVSVIHHLCSSCVYIDQIEVRIVKKNISGTILPCQQM